MDFFITMAICNTVVVNLKPKMKRRIDGIEKSFIGNNTFNVSNATKFLPFFDY